MVAAKLVRRQIEDTLAHRVPGALSPRQRTVVPHVVSGVPEIDALLGGGLPVGAITEVIGSSCSGRTSFALAFIAELTSAGQITAWIDVADALDPESAAAAGVDLSRLLWIRCGSDAKQPERNLVQQSDVPGLLCREARKNSPSGGGGSPHPRNEVRGMPEAVQALLHRPDKSGTAQTYYPSPTTQDGENPVEARRRRKNIGTPGMPNRPLQPEADGTFPRRAWDRTEQAPTDRQPPRRGEHFHQQARHPAAIMPCCAETPTMRMQARRGNVGSTPALNKDALLEKTPAFGKKTGPRRSETLTALDQAIRAADLLLSAGGFAALILDLGSTPAEFASRIPMATWFRFRAAAERSRTTILLLTQHPCARSSAGLVLRLKASSVTTAGDLFTGRSYEVSVCRQRFEAVEEQHDEAGKVVTMRKPPQSERCVTWSRNTVGVPFAERAHEKTVFAWADTLR
ncbi:MAG: hypothetical protein M3Y50_15640 [Acidobacteriota bacterium]|nr:hypothetical protein [Acidobacteriota bacterium]